ncbi:hypothetical protein SKAU_G00026500 [Synaphobranchus kaupii]|uniref:Melanin-concentrating hormone n=1 Tax=Synaphobranchus kaupii TaxID=118154 RepID=A0A9Q1GER1_SYNKA|nr:hypothetical protein SKAU_G00026500 [Synaphobranchus kaupii]
MKKGLPISLFLLSCAYGLPMILDTKESTTRLNKLHDLTETENNVTVRTLQSHLPLNSTVHPLNITENNDTIPMVNVVMTSITGMTGFRFLNAPPCRLSVCAVNNLVSSLQYGDERAGGLTNDPHGIGKK